MLSEIAFIAIGSNIGDSITIVNDTFEVLGKMQHCRLIARSSLYRTEAVSDIKQDDYINAMVKVETQLQPMALLLELQSIENAYYRQRQPSQRWAPRTLDLDIILFGEQQLDDTHLTVPHAEFSKRLFVLHPLFEIDGDGDRLFPGLENNLSQLIKQAPSIRMEKL